ncbi:hypothetical protein NPIL_428351 [Nephila pilipes]|uniref:Uncharacterized protein n=1 Tax=Nephila pilipes TaxID=299642 RepID=A0A8X6I7G2_NEPPI|nr:hypothetical protein NPIL_428351 [Nephila pilipes]
MDKLYANEEYLPLSYADSEDNSTEINHDIFSVTDLSPAPIESPLNPSAPVFSSKYSIARGTPFGGRLLRPLEDCP